MTNYRLKECPFCGAEAELRNDSGEISMEGSMDWWVMCTFCSANVGSFFTAGIAVEEWNLRDGGYAKSINDKVNRRLSSRQRACPCCGQGTLTPQQENKEGLFVYHNCAECGSDVALEQDLIMNKLLNLKRKWRN